MATQDYTKLKNAELEALLKQRGLQTGGKKADMVGRLQAADAESSAAAPTPAPAAPGAATVDESKDEKAAPATASTPAVATTTTSDAAPASGEASAAAPTEQKLTREEREAERAAKLAADEKKYGQGMSATDIDEEIARRKKRAEKYGLPMNAEAEEGIKALERAKKFGTTTVGSGETAEGETKPVAGLDSALPDRQRKRGREEGAGGRGGKRQRGGGAERPAAAQQNGGQKGSWMSEADKAKADARKARFAAAP